MASLAEKLAAKKAEAAKLAESKTESKAESSAKVTEIKQVATAIQQAPASALNKGVEDPKSVVDLVPRIKELADLSGEDLSTAMKELKKALMQNPEAVSLMLPEDCGAMVEALRRLTGQTIVAATAKKEKKAPKRTLTEAEMLAAFEEL